MTWTLPKDEVLDLVRQQPEQVNVEDLIHQLYLREKLAAAERDVAEGKTLSMDEVRATSTDLGDAAQAAGQAERGGAKEKGQ